MTYQLNFLFNVGVIFKFEDNLDLIGSVKVQFDVSFVCFHLILSESAKKGDYYDLEIYFIKIGHAFV